MFVVRALKRVPRVTKVVAVVTDDKRLCSTRFSRAADVFEVVRSPCKHGVEAFVQDMKDRIRAHGVTHLVNVPAVVDVDADAALADAVEAEGLDVRVLHPKSQLQSILHNKIAFSNFQ